MVSGAQQSALMRSSTSLGLLIKFEKHCPISLLRSTPMIGSLYEKTDHFLQGAELRGYLGVMATTDMLCISGVESKGRT